MYPQMCHPRLSCCDGQDLRLPTPAGVRKVALIIGQQSYNEDGGFAPLGAALSALVFIRCCASRMPPTVTSPHFKKCCFRLWEVRKAWFLCTTVDTDCFLRQGRLTYCRSMQSEAHVTLTSICTNFCSLCMT
mmetsp:Transcript_142017/g.247382  ORF Transcript_142017/g.247382 Transcript_142017/m.247382 type:complete len:132 (-) Transcript_142017:1059-1454(-)